MSQKKKKLVKKDAHVDLRLYNWNDHRFSDILVKENNVDAEEAMSISKFLREEINRMENPMITMSVLEKLIGAKMMEYGYPESSPIRLDQSFFVKNGIALSENAKRVLERRYLKKNSDGNPIEGPGDLFERVSRHIAEAERNYGGEESDVKRIGDIYYKMMTDFEFLPNSPTLMNAGRRLAQLAACFVLPIEDSMDGIFDSLKGAALIHKSGGGTGFSFSRLRAKNSRVGTTGGVASGPVSFMKIFNTATEQVKQGGTRRGANMAILRVDHPDIMEFIYCKKEDGTLNNFNISVGLTESFMEAVRRGGTYDLVNPDDGEKEGELNAAEVYGALVEQAWDNGDPGIIFLDRINKDNPTPTLGEIESTNPCGEQPLLPMEACNLGSINLAKFVTGGEDKPVVDYDRLRETVHYAVRFLDNTIDMSEYPMPEITEMVRGNRKVGLGVMGFADLLFQLGVPYNSEKGLRLAEDVMGFVQVESHAASKKLTESRGVFKNFDKSVFKDKNGSAYRNATTTTIAPTGTLSIIADCSSGIEPLFALSFVRNVMDNDKLVETNKYFEKVAKDRGFYSEDLMKRIAEKGTIHDMTEIPADVRKIFTTAHDVTPEWHIRMQAAFQKHTDNAVSKTVNLPREATVADVRRIYDLAHELNCKGVTIYRDGSKENQVLSFSAKEKQPDRFMAAVQERPETLEGFTTRIPTGLGQLYVTVTELEGRPFEVFATIGKSGRSTTAKTEAIGRLVSLALRAGVSAEEIVDQLKGIGGEHPVFRNGGLVLSIPDAISRVLENRYMKDNTAKSNEKTENGLLGEKCPECGQKIAFEEGCKKCHHCGFSKCG